MNRAIVLLLALATVRCATVAHGRHQTVPVASNPSGAVVRVTCGNRTTDGGITPVEVQLRRKAETCAITLTKEGYAPAEVKFRRLRSGWIYANVLPGVVTGTASGVGVAAAAILDDQSDSVIVGAFFGGFLLGVGVPALIDHATGAMYRHEPERVDVTLTASP